MRIKRADTDVWSEPPWVQWRAYSNGRVAPTPRKYLRELRDRGQTLAFEAPEHDPDLALNEAAKGVGERRGVNATHCAADASKP